MKYKTCLRPGGPGKAQLGLTLFAAFLALTTAWAAPAPAPIPPAASLLPDDTLVVVTAPDYAKLRELWKESPQSQLWQDPAMKAFREKFLAKWDEELVKPLERDLGIKLADYTGLPQGQVTFAITQNGWPAQEGQAPGWLLLVDTRDKADLLKKNLAELRKKWVDSGKAVRTERIRETDFTVVTLSTNDIPKTIRKFLPESSEVQELGQDKEKPAPAKKPELFLGRWESLLVMGSESRPLGKVMTRLAGGSMPTLGELAGYQANYNALFRESPFFAWVNAQPLLAAISRASAAKKENPEAPNPFDTLKPEKLINATGLGALKTVALTYQHSQEGGLFQLFFGVPEAGRQGLFKILAGEPKTASPPPFVPADAVKFQRWRMDGQKAWAAVEKMLGDISSQWLSGVNFILDTANSAARQKDPSFDIRKNLIGNLGDDFLSYEKAPRDPSTGGSASPPTLFLVGSPNSEQLAAALKSILVFLDQQAGNPAEREFLGRKIFSVRLPSLPLPSADASKPAAPRLLHYAATSGYLAVSTDAGLLEEYLRSSETPPKALKDTPGLAEAFQKVANPGTSVLGYENDAQTIRPTFEALRLGASGETNGPPNPAASLLAANLGLPGSELSLRDWLDFSLLPPFDKVAKYISFSVFGGSANVDGITFAFFSPTPPALYKASSPPAKK